MIEGKEFETVLIGFNPFSLPVRHNKMLTIVHPNDGTTSAETIWTPQNYQDLKRMYQITAQTIITNPDTNINVRFEIVITIHPEVIDPIIVADVDQYILFDCYTVPSIKTIHVDGYYVDNIDREGVENTWDHSYTLFYTQTKPLEFNDYRHYFADFDTCDMEIDLDDSNLVTM
jgi:hypothetical protein